jgi:cell division septation protein DedD
MARIDDLKMQLDFLWEELGAYSHVMKVLTKANSIKEACNVVLREYERPAVVVNNDKAGITKALNARTGAGKEFYDKFSTKSTASEKKSAGYFVQYGAFSSKNNAKKRLYNVESKGLGGTIEKFDGYYRVINGYFDTVAEANEVAAVSRDAGYNVLIKERKV